MKTCHKTEWQVHAYCLMSNHFHPVVATPLPNLDLGMTWLLEANGIPKDSQVGRRQFAALTGNRRAEERAADYEQLRRDWVLASEAFRQGRFAAAGERVGPSHYGAERQETAVQ